MPRTMRVCSTSGCPELHRDGGKCPTCRRSADRQRGTFRERGYRAGHDRFRRAVLARDPQCQLCGIAPSVVADHYPISRRELVAAGHNPDDPARGRGLCTPCDKSQGARRESGFHIRGDGIQAPTEWRGIPPSTP